MLEPETFTPAPWHIGKQNRHDAWIHNAAGQTVCYIHNATGYRPDCSDDPNAKLIASAPELLACLIDFVNTVDGEHTIDQFNHARLIIAKATKGT